MMQDSAADKMVAYMNEKYDDQFEYSAPFGGGPGAASKQIIVSSAQYPEAKIWVQYFERDGREVWTDNYTDYRFEEQTRGFLQDLLESVYHSKVALNYSVSAKGTVNDFTQSTTFDEYISSIKADIGFQACVLLEKPTVNVRAFEEDFKKAIADSGLIACGTIYFSEDPDQMDQVFQLSLKELDRLDQLYFDMDGPNSYRYFEWRMGDGR